MVYIYMDESWDLGFSQKEWSSRFFIVTCLMVQNPKDVEIIMKNVRKWAWWKGIKINGTFFHSNKESKDLVQKILKITMTKPVNVIVSIMDKTRILDKRKQNPHQLYNDLVASLLEQYISRFLTPSDCVNFIASRRETKKSLKEQFYESIKWKIGDKCKVIIEIKGPWSDKGLEVVDAIAFAFHQKYEHDNRELYDLIKENILFECKNF